MDSTQAIEILGYVASALIIVSITQKSILKLRLLGLVGGLAFLVYSIAIEAYPIAVVNVIAVVIHAWYLRKLLRRKDEVFRILRVRPESKYLLDFLDFYHDEMHDLFEQDPEHEPGPEMVTAFILRDMVPAGLLIGRARSDGTFEVKLDFVIPQYRDFKIARYVYSKDSALFAGLAPSSVWVEASNRTHAKYLRRVGFSACATIPDRYEIQLTTASRN